MFPTASCRSLQRTTGHQATAPSRARVVARNDQVYFQNNMLRVARRSIRGWVGAPGPPPPRTPPPAAGPEGAVSALIVGAGTVVDGPGAPPLTADVGVRDGRVADVGRLPERA